MDTENVATRKRGVNYYESIPLQESTEYNPITDLANSHVTSVSKTERYLG